MSEDRTASAGLAIERYIAGLREELALLGPAEAKELAHDVRDMLVDAAREDPERAFAEMDRLGEPAALAGDLLAEHGFSAEGGIPSASWMRLGVAAVIDIFVGLALPVVAVVAFYSAVWSAISGPTGVAVGFRIATFALGLGFIATAGWFAWRTWAPWRRGGIASSPGMALAHVAVVTLGGKRTVVRESDLHAAGLPVPARRNASAWIAVAMAALAFVWSVGMVSTGALDPSGAGAVTRFAGSPSAQRSGVTNAVIDLLDAVQTPANARRWPAMDAIDTTGLVEAIRPRTGTAGRVGRGTPPENVAPGRWTVSVTTGERPVVLSYRLRLEWSASGGPSPVWVLSGYTSAP